ncbi:MAG: hypothetical protein Q8R40_01050 [bacterium]|nr:hypothetical protein [bacterium]
MHKNMFKKDNVVICVILLSAVLVSALIFYSSKQHQMSVVSQTSNLPNVKLTANEIYFDSIKPIDIIKKIYQIIDDSSNVKFKKEPENYRMIWRTEDNWDVFDRYATGIEVPIQVDFCERKACVRNENIKALNQRISDIFLNNGFTVNQLNTSTSEDDERLYDYMLAFERGIIKCSLVTNPDLMGDESLPPMSVAIHYSVACSDQIKKHYDEQLPFLEAINDHRFSIIVEKIIGNFARLEIGGRGGGGMYGIAKNINHSWKIIVQAQEAISCILIDQYQIPKEIYPVNVQGCYEKSDMPPVFDYPQK